MKRFYSLFVLMAALVSFAAYQTINIGTNPNDGTGDTLRNAFIKVNANTTQTIADFAAVNGAIVTINGTLVTLNNDILAAEAHIVNATNWPGYRLWLTNLQPTVTFGSVTGNTFTASNSIYIPKFGLGSIDTFMSQGYFRTTNSSSGKAIGLSLDGANFNVVGTGLNTLVNVDQAGVVTASNFVHQTWKWVDILQTGAAMASNPAGDPPVLTQVPGQNYFGYGFYADSTTAGDKTYFSIQGVHKFALTNAQNPDVWFEPHIHIMTTNRSVGSTCRFQVDLYYGTVLGTLTNYYTATNTFTFTNIYQHGILSFGNVTNNALSGRSSVLFKGRIMRVTALADSIGAFPVWVDSIDIHMPTQELGSTGQGGD